MAQLSTQLETAHTPGKHTLMINGEAAADLEPHADGLLVTTAHGDQRVCADTDAARAFVEACELFWQGDGPDPFA